MSESEPEFDIDQKPTSDELFLAMIDASDKVTSQEGYSPSVKLQIKRLQREISQIQNQIEGLKHIKEVKPELDSRASLAACANKKETSKKISTTRPVTSDSAISSSKKNEAQTPSSVSSEKLKAKVARAKYKVAKCEITCPFCDNPSADQPGAHKFKRMRLYLEHYTRHHAAKDENGQIIWQCFTCAQVFKSRQSRQCFSSHIKQSNCFNDDAIVRREMCSLCNARFKRAAHLKRHMAIHAEEEEESAAKS